MTGKQRKNLAKLRLVLSVIAVLLAGVMVLSGVMHFVVDAPVSEPEETSGPTETIGYTVPETETENGEVTPTAATTQSTEDEQNVELETLPQIPAVGGNRLPVSTGNDVDKEPQPAETAPAVPESAPPEPSVFKNEISETSALITDPTETSAPVTDPTETSAPVTDPTETSAPVTDPSETSAPVTDSSETSAPVTDPSEASATVTDPSETSAPATGPLETGASATDPSETSTPATEPLETGASGTDPVETTGVTKTNDTSEDATEQPSDPTVYPGDDGDETKIPWNLLFWCSSGLLALDLIAIAVLSYCIHRDKARLATGGKMRKHTGGTVDSTRQTESLQPKAGCSIASVAIGTVHQMGGREYQQDSMGYTAVLNDRGMLAVVADGMGGLADGEKVSRKIVMDMLGMAQYLNAGQVNGILWKLVNQVNEDVNRMLGPDGLYKSGSTVVSVLVMDGKFQWVAVGDSRIYLYRKGYASPLNRDHDQLQAWMPEVLEGKRSMEEVLRNPDGRKLTSFIGMGQLKHVDGSIMPIALEAGDRLVLMSDGIYNVINEDWLAAILKRYPDVNQAASAIERSIKEVNHPHQDNYTAIVLGF